MGSVVGAGADLDGKFTAAGPISVVTLGNVHDSTFTASGPITALNLGNVADSTISVAGSIGNIAVHSWLSTGAPNQLNAISIGNLSSVGDFDASIALSGPTGNGPTLIGGALADGYWHVVGNTGLVMAGRLRPTGLAISPIR